jgi:hypothetical protein
MRHTALLFTLVGAAGLFASACAAQGRDLKIAPETDRFLKGKPFSLDDLRVALAVPEPRLRKAIENRGLDFVLVPGDLEKLREAGASESLLQLVRQHARTPPPPPEPPKPVLGNLGLTCEPAECEILVNGASKGVTSGGKLDLTGLPAGSVTIDFRKDGYVTVQVAASVEPGRMTPAFARLEPDQATREVRGAELYRRILDSFGGEAALRDLRSVTVAGTAEVFAPGGKRSSWSMQSRLKLPDKAFYRVKGGSLTYEFAYAGAQYSSNGKIKGEEAQRFETYFRMYREYQIPLLLDRIARYKLIAPRVLPVPGEDYFLVADGVTEKITLALDRDSRPQFVKIETATGLGSGDQVIYSGYARRGNATLPLVMQIRLSNVDQQGLEVRLDDVSVNQTFSERDFQIRKKVFR